MEHELAALQSDGCFGGNTFIVPDQVEYFFFGYKCDRSFGPYLAMFTGAVAEIGGIDHHGGQFLSGWEPFIMKIDRTSLPIIFETVHYNDRIFVKITKIEAIRQWPFTGQ